MAQIRTTFTSDDKDVLAALARMEKANLKLIEQNRKLAQESKQAGKEAKQSADGVADAIAGGVQDLAGMVTGYLSVGGAIKLVNDGIQHTIKLQKEAADAQISDANKQLTLMRNTFALGAEERSRVVGSVTGLSQTTGVAPGQIYGPLAEAISAKGALSTEVSIAATELALRAAPEREDASRAMAGGIMDVANVTGVGDARQNFGFLLAGQAISRVPTPEAFAQNVVPAATALRLMGNTPAEALALPAAMTTATGDRTGATSATASIALGQQLKDFFAKERIDVQGTFAQIAYLQQDEHAAQREKFSAGASFELKQKEVINQLLADPQSPLGRTLTAARRDILDPQQAEAKVDEYFRFVGSQPGQQTAALARGLEGSTARYDAAQNDAATTSVVRDSLTAVLGRIYQDPVMGSVDRGLKQTEFLYRTTIGREQGNEVQEDILQDMIAQQRHGITILGQRGEAQGAVATQAREDIAYLREQLAELKKLNVVMQETRRHDVPKPLVVEPRER